MHMAVAILRTENGFDYSDILATGVDGSGAMKKSKDDQSNGSMSDLLAVGQTRGSNDSLNRIESQGIASVCIHVLHINMILISQTLPFLCELI